MINASIPNDATRRKQPMSADPRPDLDGVNFNSDDYNKLPLVSEAEALFESQLKSAGLNRAELFSQLALLFYDSKANKPGPYAVYLIHRHYELKPGERMVATDTSTRPSTEFSPNIVPHIWSINEEAREFRFVSDPSTHPPPPPREFFSKFRSFLEEKRIDTLGICYAENDLKDGDIYEEGDGPGDRERMVTMISELQAGTDSYEVVWSPRHDPKSQTLIMAVRCCCNGVGCWTTTIGSVVLISLQPNTIATIFGAVQDAALNEQIVLAQLFGKGVVLEQTATLDGPKGSRPYNVSDDKKNYAVVWGPFKEKKKIQVALYWTNSSGFSLQPIDGVAFQEFSDDKLHTKVTLIPVYHKDKKGNSTLRTVVNVTRMGVKA